VDRPQKVACKRKKSRVREKNPKDTLRKDIIRNSVHRDFPGEGESINQGKREGRLYRVGSSRKKPLCQIIKKAQRKSHGKQQSKKTGTSSHEGAFRIQKSLLQRLLGKKKRTGPRTATKERNVALKKVEQPFRSAPSEVVKRHTQKSTRNHDRKGLRGGEKNANA